MPRMSDPNRAGRRCVALAAAAVALCLTSAAAANPRPLPFTYQSETLPEGSAEIEQFVDFVPVRALSSSGSADPVWYLGTQFTTEFEYGLTDKLELGLYVTFVPQPGDAFASVPQLPSGNGAKQRLRYRLADPGAWPIDVALYGEIAENEREIELEAKLILQRRFGRVRVITNLWAEHEFYFNGQREWVLNPTLGATAELSPRYHVGLEGWMRAEYLTANAPDAPPMTTRGFNLGPHVYVGPTFLANFGRLWWTTGAYARVTDTERAVMLNDQFGRFWVRTIIGIGF
jgi:hypothetical protein